METNYEGLASLARKKAAIMSDLKKLPKDKRNTQQNYNYASAEGVFDTIRALMVEHGLVLFTSAVSGHQDAFTSKNGTPGLHTTVQYRMLWVDTETGATVEDFWLSEGDDYQDKGYSKCATLALKYYLMTTFIVSSGDATDDPDSGLRRKGQRQQHNGQSQAATAAKSNEPPQPRTSAGNGAKTPQDGDMREITLTAVVSESGKAGNTRYRFASVEQLPAVYAYSRDVFIKGSWCTETDWQQHGTYQLPASCVASVKYHMFKDSTDGYWTVEAVENFQPDFLTDVVF